MPELPAEKYAIWLLNKRRGSWSILLLVAAIGAGLATMQAMKWHVSDGCFWLAMGGYGVAFIALYRRFAQWANDPATAVVSASGLTVHCEATGYSLAVAYSAIADCTCGASKDIFWLRIKYLDGSKAFLHTTYGQKIFAEMAASCEQHFKAYQLALRLSQPRARR